MARPARWKDVRFKQGLAEIALSSWRYFSDYVNQELLDYTHYMYRGHADAEWRLEPTLDRVVKSATSPQRDRHLEKFKFETRGRRGPHPASLHHENDWWALGQHHGLATPLLDWTESPFVALYFAASAGYGRAAKEVAVYALSERGIRRRNEAINSSDTVQLINAQKPTVKIVRPLSDENSRLVSQRGLFTRGPNNMPLEKWIQTFCPEDSETMDLIKVVIPAEGLSDCLRYLNRMNINHSTLFPDLTGASNFCNLHLTLHRY
jgi:hypothetical protein